MSNINAYFVVETWGFKNDKGKVIPFYRYGIATSNYFTGEAVVIYLKPDSKSKGLLEMLYGKPDINNVTSDHITVTDED